VGNVDALEGDSMTPELISHFFLRLYAKDYLNAEDSDAVIQLMTNKEFSNGLVSPLPQTVAVSHKFGERAFDDSNSKQLHDCGIVYAPEKPYILCVMTKGTDFDAESAAIRHISGTVYTEVMHGHL
jgi:formylmethanofuran dehydrogenase subunit D